MSIKDIIERHARQDAFMMLGRPGGINSLGDIEPILKDGYRQVAADLRKATLEDVIEQTMLRIGWDKDRGEFINLVRRMAQETT